MDGTDRSTSVSLLTRVRHAAVCSLICSRNKVWRCRSVADATGRMPEKSFFAGWASQRITRTTDAARGCSPPVVLPARSSSWMHSAVKPREAGVTARSRASVESRPTLGPRHDRVRPGRPSRPGRPLRPPRPLRPSLPARRPHPAGPPAWPPGFRHSRSDPLSGCSRVALYDSYPFANRTNHFRPLRQDEWLAYHTETSLETARRRRQWSAEEPAF